MLKVKFEKLEKIVFENTPPSPPEGTKKFEFVVFLQGRRVPSGRPFLFRGQKSLLNTLKCVEFYRH